MGQDDVFFKGEGDAWFMRNRQALVEKAKWDGPLAIVDRYLKDAPVLSIAELGCANGWRLAELSKRFPNASLSGLDAGQLPIEEGKKLWPTMDLRHALISEVPFRQVFDLVVVNFVLHWVDRASILKALAETDRMVRPGGHLILGDFLPDTSTRRKYHHLPNEEVFTFKEDYPAMFRAKFRYEEIGRIVFNHDDPAAPAETCDPSSRAVCTLLKKPENR